MYTPRFSLTPELVGIIGEIERLYGQLEALKLPKVLELKQRQSNLIQSAYYSNKIEGNPLSLYEVTNLLLDEKVPANKNEKEVKLYFDMLDRLHEYREVPLSTELIEQIHLELFAGMQIYAGKIRDEIVAVGKYVMEGETERFKVKHMPPFHAKEEIVSALSDLFEYLEIKELPAMVGAGLLHHQFLYLHPFEDGNGRVCRTLTALYLIQHQYQINKYFILDDYYDLDRVAYSNALHTADEGPKTKWLVYFANGVKYSLQSALLKARNMSRNLSVKNRPTPKETLVLRMLDNWMEITSNDVASELKVSRQQAHNLLTGLVEKDLIKKHGLTKSSYYSLK